jgi:rhamnosyltransferase
LPTLENAKAREPLSKCVSILGTRGIPARYGGFETAAEIIALGLQRSGFRVVVACEEPGDKSQSRREELDGVELYYLPVRESLRPLSEVLYDVRSLWELGRRSDIVYMCGYGAGFSFWLMKLFRKTLIVNLDGLEWARPKFNWFFRFALRFNEFLGILAADAVVADSKWMQNYVRKIYRRRAYYIPYGCDVGPDSADWNAHEIARWNSEVGKSVSPDDYYLVLARLEPDNNIAQLISGYSSSNAARKLLVVGSCQSKNYDSQLKSIAREDKRIIMAGSVYDLHLRNVLRRNCAAYLHGHMVGGTSPSLLEALAAGSVILATDVPFNREVVGDNGHPAFFFSPHPSQIADVIDKVDNEVLELRKIARVTGPARIQEAYERNTMVHDYCAMMKSL